VRLVTKARSRGASSPSRGRFVPGLTDRGLKAHVVTLGRFENPFVTVESFADLSIEHGASLCVGFEEDWHRAVRFVLKYETLAERAADFKKCPFKGAECELVDISLGRKVNGSARG
jgi:hypothetical protein